MLYLFLHGAGLATGRGARLCGLQMTVLGTRPPTGDHAKRKGHAMPLRVRARFWLEVVSTSMAAVGTLTLVRKDWIEAIFGVDPDHHSGSLEWSIVTASFAVTLIAALLASVNWRRSRKPMLAQRN